jgi:hypothetical protein
VNASRRSALREVLLAILLFGLALAAAHFTREKRHEGRLASDEPEWIAISILHWRQFALGEAPAGAELDPPAERSDNPWKQGVQRTTFGYMNPCLPKLVWGAVLHAVGHREASPYSFQLFYKPAPQRQRDAWLQLVPAEQAARRTVLVLTALSGLLLVYCARRLAPGWAGWLAGGAALALWFATPLVQSTSNYIRTDHFMLPLCLAGLLVALRTPRPGLAWGALVGVACGLSVASKLNGGLLCVTAAAWCALAVLRDRRDLRRSAAGLALAAVLTIAVFYTLDPRLWGAPIEGVRDMLARWDALMSFFQDEHAPRTGVAVARTLPERIGLFARSLPKWNFALGSLSGVAAVLGLAALGYRALQRDERAQTVLAFASIFVVGTIVWLPLDWERFYLTATPALVLLQVAPVVAFASSASVRRSPPPAP